MFLIYYLIYKLLLIVYISTFDVIFGNQYLLVIHGNCLDILVKYVKITLITRLMSTNSKVFMITLAKWVPNELPTITFPVQP